MSTYKPKHVIGELVEEVSKEQIRLLEIVNIYYVFETLDTQKQEIFSINDVELLQKFIPKKGYSDTFEYEKNGIKKEYYLNGYHYDCADVSGNSVDGGREIDMPFNTLRTEIHDMWVTLQTQIDQVKSGYTQNMKEKTFTYLEQQLIEIITKEYEENFTELSAWMHQELKNKAAMYSNLFPCVSNHSEYEHSIVIGEGKKQKILIYQVITYNEIPIFCHYIMDAEKASEYENLTPDDDIQFPNYTEISLAYPEQIKRLVSSTLTQAAEQYYHPADTLKHFGVLVK